MVIQHFDSVPKNRNLFYGISTLCSLTAIDYLDTDLGGFQVFCIYSVFNYSVLFGTVLGLQSLRVQSQNVTLTMMIRDSSNGPLPLRQQSKILRQ